MASWLSAMRGPVEGQESKGHWLATKSCKNQPLTCLQTLPNPHSCSIYLNILGPPKSNSLRGNQAQEISQPPKRADTHQPSDSELGDLERKQG